MDVPEIIRELDREISRLTILKTAMQDYIGEAPAPYNVGLRIVRRGRPPGKKSAPKPAPKRTLSEEGRRRISDALKARHAARKAALTAQLPAPTPIAAPAPAKRFVSEDTRRRMSRARKKVVRDKKKSSQ